jgi:hypothetical protein
MLDSRSAKLAAFCDWVRENIAGDEKGKAQVFLDRLLWWRSSPKTSASCRTPW